MTLPHLTPSLGEIGAENNDELVVKPFDAGFRPTTPDTHRNGCLTSPRTRGEGVADDRFLAQDHAAGTSAPPSKR